MRSSRIQQFATAAILALSAVAPLSAESINPPTTPQTAPMNKQEKKNLDMVLDWWRVVIQGGHLDQTSKYQAEDYIQHNPNVNTGRAGFVEFFSKFSKPKDPIPEKLANPPVVMGAKGDYVWLIWETEQKDPRDPSKTYHSNSFDVLRIQNGKVQEHWDSAMKMPGSGNVNTGVSPKPPMEWNTGKLDKQEKDPGPGHRRAEGHAAVRPPGTGRQDHGPGLYPAQSQGAAGPRRIQGIYEQRPGRHRRRSSLSGRMRRR